MVTTTSSEAWRPAHEAAQATWPQVKLPLETFAAHAAAVGAEPPGAPGAETFASDLYLACACARGDATAIAVFERTVLQPARAAIARVRSDGQPPAPAADASVTDADLTSKRPCLGGRCLEWSPERLAQIALWLDPTTLPAAGSPVTSWGDALTGRAARPTNPSVAPKVTADPDLGPGVRFAVDQFGLSVPHDPGLAVGTKPFTIACVLKAEKGNTARIFLARKATGGLRPAAGFELTLTPRTFAADLGLWSMSTEQRLTSPRAGLADGAPHILLARRRATSAEIHIDGVLEATATVDPAFDLTTESELFVGVLSQAPNLFNGVIAALVVVTGELSDAELAQLQTFLTNAFGL